MKYTGVSEQLFRLLFCGLASCFFQIFINSKPDYLLHQRCRDRLANGKLNCTFRCFVIRQFFPEELNGRRCRIKTDMIFVCSIVNEHAMKFERRHVIADQFFGLGRRLFDGFPHFYQEIFGAWRQRGEVLIHAFEFSWFHSSSDLIQQK